MSELAEQIALELIPFNVKVPDDQGRPYNFEQSKITWQRIAVAKALDEMALRVFEDTRERAAKLAESMCGCGIAEAIRAMQPEENCPHT